MAYEDLLKHFDEIDRVRLFDDTWETAEQYEQFY